MNVIRTDENGWQKKMAAYMKNKEEFTIVTNDDILAQRMAKGGATAGLFRRMFLGSAGAAATGVGAAAAGSSTAIGSVAAVPIAAKLAAISAIAATADPEPFSKAALIVIAVVLLLAGGGFIYLIWRALQSGKYKCKVKSEVSFFGISWKYSIKMDPVVP